MLMISYLWHRGSRGDSSHEGKTTADQVNEAKRRATSSWRRRRDERTLCLSGKTLRRGSLKGEVRHGGGQGNGRWRCSVALQWTGRDGAMKGGEGILAGHGSINAINKKRTASDISSEFLVVYNNK